MTQHKTEELAVYDSYQSLRGSGAFGAGAHHRFGHFTPAVARPVKHRDTPPVTSYTFAQLMESLDLAGAHDLKYLKLAQYLQKTGKLLDIPMDTLPLGFSDKAECATDRVNFPLMASIYQTVTKAEIQRFVQEIASLPPLARDLDYQSAAQSLFRAVGARVRVHEQFPGFSDAWSDFFTELFVPGFVHLPQLTDDTERKLLFEALASIVSRRVTSFELRPHLSLIEAATEAFHSGSVEAFGDALYALSAAMTELEPPEPPCDEPDEGEGEPDGEPQESDDAGQSGGEHQADDDQPAQGGGSGEPEPDDEQGQGGEGTPDADGNESGSDGQDEQPGEGEPDPGGEPPAEPDPGQGEDEQPGDGEPQEQDSQDEGEPEPGGRDPFAQLAQFMRNSDPANMPEPASMNAAEQFEVGNPDFDMENVSELLALETDVSVPQCAPGLQSVTYRVKTPPSAAGIWGLMRSTYSPEITGLTRLIDEFYRIKTIQERGLLSGRADGGRLHRAYFGARDVFKRAFLDSVGHMDMLLVLDESGSMRSQVRDFKQPSAELLKLFKRDIVTGYEREPLFRGEKVGRFDNDRANLARLMGFLMLEAARSLDGFNVAVAGYTDTYDHELPEPLQPVAHAVADMARKDGNDEVFGAPVVRLLGDKAHPHGVLTASALANNADIQALAWAIERLEKSSSDQKCIIFAADGLVEDERDVMGTLMQRARRAGIYIHFADMSEGTILPNSPLNKLPKTEVNSFKGLMECMTTVLDTVTSQYR